MDGLNEAAETNKVWRKDISFFDLHCDTLYECYKNKYSIKNNFGHLDLNRVLKYKKAVQLFATFLPDRIKGEKAVSTCFDIIDLAHKMERAHPLELKIIRGNEDLDMALEKGLCACILTLEGGGMLGGKLENIYRLAESGVKVITLTWNNSNELGNGCLSRNKKGLTSFGIACLNRMEQVGIIPDVSHLNEQGFWDTLEHTKKEVIASHSVSFGVNRNKRNLRNDQFSALKERGGIVGLNFCGAQLMDKKRFDISDKDKILYFFEAHLDCFLSQGGSEILCLGLDLDGTDLPSGWGGVENLLDIYEYLLKRNYPEEFLERLFFENAYNFFKKVF